MTEQTTPPCSAPEPAAKSMIAYQIRDDLLLAGQPQPSDWMRLAMAGYQTVINIRSDAERAAVQATAAEAAGLQYHHLYLPAYQLEPEHLGQFAQLLAEVSPNKVVLHCRTATRVALVWMLYRVVHQGASQEEAAAELRAVGYDESRMESLLFCAEDYFQRVAEQAEAAS